MRVFFKGTKIIFLKEVRENFSSPLLYILTALFTLMMGWLFFNYLALSQSLTTNTISAKVMTPLLGNMNFTFIFLAPLLTMRLISEEKKQKTLDFLLSSELGPLQIIIGKYLSALVSVLFMLGLTLVYPIALSLSGHSDWSGIILGYTGLIYSIMCYLAVGLFASSLTENQIVASFLSFAFLLTLMLLVASANATHNQIIAQFFQYLSVAFHFESFLRGTIKNYNIAYLFSFLSFFFYLTNKSLESRRL